MRLGRAAPRLAYEVRGERAEQAGQLRPMPTRTPNMKTERALARPRAGKRSPLSEGAAGAHDASPTPTPRRKAKSCQKFLAKPEATVSRLQTKTPAERIHLRPALSARRPSGSPTKA